MNRRFLGPLVAVLLLAIGCPKDPLVCDGDAKDCGGSCTNLLGDAANCGACGVACAPGSTCSNGACACAAGHVSCNGDCIDPLTDRAFCGASETCTGWQACSPTFSCQGGVCVGVCIPVPPTSCYDGPTCTAGAGECRTGTLNCVEDPLPSCVCNGQVLPAVELCDGLDNDCDGAIDQLLTRGCYEGSNTTVDSLTGLPLGACRSGVQVCSNGGWENCVGQVLPVAEDCGEGGAGNGIDENCDGAIDETCGCSQQEVQPCYTGPAGTQAVGECRSGVRTCAAGTWGPCTGEVVPVPETCANGTDDDCNGIVDDPAVCGS